MIFSRDKKPIHVVVVDDSTVVRQVLTNAINSDPQLRVVGTGVNGREAVELAAKLKPDIITMDMNMPVMGGIEATKQIMAYHPTPILILSSTLFRNIGENKPFDAISFGALDVMDKGPLRGANGGDYARALTERIKVLARIKVVTHPLAKFERRFPADGATPAKPAVAAPLPAGEKRIVAIAASTGGPQALLQVLKQLPANLPCGVVIVQHISEGFDAGLADWLNEQCDIDVCLGTDNAPLAPGVAYIAPSGSHMTVTPAGRLKLTNEEPVDCQKPSATVLFHSVAHVYRDRAICAILTGMGADGVDGLKSVKAAGGKVVAQDQSTCVVFGMPKAAIELGVVDWICPIEQVAPAILRALRLPQPKVALR